MHQINLVETWLSSVALSQSGAQTTNSLYRRGLSYFLSFIDAKPEDIQKDYEEMQERDFKHKYGQLIRAWNADMLSKGYTPGSVGSFAVAVRSFFKHNDLPLSFMASIRRKVTFHNRDITKEEVVHILSVSSPRDRAFFAVMAQSGLRPSTLCALRIKHLEPDYSQNLNPLKISVPEDLTKGQYHSYLTFIGEDANRYLRDYLKTRPNLNRDSYVFTKQASEEPMTRNTISSSFRKAARMLRDKGLMDFEQKQKDKPAEVRLYSLRKWFRKYAIQAGFENVDFWMGHTGPGVDSAYRPKDEEFYRKIYAEKAMPFLRLETATPSETEKQIGELRRENTILKDQVSKVAPSIEALQKRFEELEKRLSDVLKRQAL
jgi:integrase